MLEQRVRDHLCPKCADKALAKVKGVGAFIAFCTHRGTQVEARVSGGRLIDADFYHNERRDSHHTRAAEREIRG